MADKGFKCSRPFCTETSPASSSSNHGQRKDIIKSNNNSRWEICLSMRQISPRERCKLRDLRMIFKNHVPNMDHKHFQSAKRSLSVIFNSKPTNQVIRYVHEGQASAKIMLEQKANF